MITQLEVSKTPAVNLYVIGNIIFSEFPSIPIHFSCAIITMLGVVLRLYPALIPARGKRCYSSKIVWTGFGAHSYSLLSGCTGSFPGVKPAWFEAYHLLPSSAEDKVCGTSLSLSTCALTACTRTTLYLLLPRKGDRDGVVGRESHYRLKDPAFEPRCGKKHFLLDTLSERPWGSPSLLYDGDRGPFPGLALNTTII